MFIFKKSQPVIYRSHTGAAFKFRQSNDKERQYLHAFAQYECSSNNKEYFLVDYSLNKDSYYAAWLLEDFSGVEDDGKPQICKKFDFQNKVGLIEKLKEADSEFAKWFESHCEPAEKKAEETADAEQLVGPADMPSVPH